jgi:hypothetical protein
VLEERVGSDSVPLSQYVYHPFYVDAVVLHYYDENTDGDLLDTNEGEYYYLQDAGGPGLNKGSPTLGAQEPFY